MALTLDRNLDQAIVDKITSNSLIAVPLLYLDFAQEGFQKYFSGANKDIPISTNSIMPPGTYLGVGGIATVNTTEESLELQSGELVVTLNGIDSSYVALVLNSQYYGGEAKLGVIILDQSYKPILDSTGTTEADPILLFKGFMSQLNVNMEDTTASISVTINNVLADWERPRVKRYNNGTQRRTYPGDKGFSNVEKIVTKEIIWEG